MLGALVIVVMVVADGVEFVVKVSCVVVVVNSNAVLVAISKGMVCIKHGLDYINNNNLFNINNVYNYVSYN